MIRYNFLKKMLPAFMIISFETYPHFLILFNILRYAQKRFQNVAKMKQNRSSQKLIIIRIFSNFSNMKCAKKSFELTHKDLIGFPTAQQFHKIKKE